MPKKARTPALADQSTASGGAAAVDRAMAILRVFTPEQPTLTLTAIAQATGLYKSTVLRLLASLEHGAMVRRTALGYQLGPQIARLFSIYSGSFSLESVVLPALETLVRDTRESAALHVVQQGQRICLFRVDSPQSVREHIKVGDILPIDCGAGARVLMAFAGARGALYDDIRRRGIAILEKDRSPEISGISAPVFAEGSRLVGAVTLTMPAHRFDRSHASLVLECARSLTAQLCGDFPVAPEDAAPG